MGNLSWNTDNDSLYSVFSDASDARVCMDRETGNSRGFAFVEYNDVDAAKKARESNQGADIDGRNVNIVFATPRESFTPGGRGGGGGGRGQERSRQGSQIFPRPGHRLEPPWRDPRWIPTSVGLPHRSRCLQVRRAEGEDRSSIW